MAYSIERFLTLLRSMEGFKENGATDLAVRQISIDFPLIKLYSPLL